MLPEEKRSQLDGIVQDMLRNKESDSNIKFVVEDFKKKYEQPEIDQLANETSVENSYQPGGIIGGIKRGMQGVRDTFNQVTNKNADIINSNQSDLSKTAQIAGQNVKFFGQGAFDVATGVASAITPDFIEKPVVEGTQKAIGAVAEKVMENEKVQKTLEDWNQFKQTHPEAAANIEAGGNFADFFANAIGVGKGVKIAGKAGEKALIAGEKISSKAVKTVGKTAENTGEYIAGQVYGFKPETVSNIIKNPEFFTKKEMANIDRDSIFTKTKNAIEKRMEALSETGKQYEGIRKSGEKVVFQDNPIMNILNKYGIGLDEKGKLIMTSESVPLGGGDVRDIENFISQYGQKELSANGFLNARKALSNMANYAEDKTDMAGKIARELRAELDAKGKQTLTGLADLDAKYAPEIKLMNKIKSTIFNRDGSIKDNAISKIANLTGRGKEQILQKMEKIIPGITEDVNILKAIEDINYAKGQKVGNYMRAVGAGSGMLAGGPLGAVAGAIVTSPRVGIQLLRIYGKIKNISGNVIDGMINKMRSGMKLVGKEKRIMDEVVNEASKKLEKRVKNIRPGMTIEDVSRNNPLIQEARKYKTPFIPKRNKM